MAKHETPESSISTIGTDKTSSGTLKPGYTPTISKKPALATPTTNASRRISTSSLPKSSGRPNNPYALTGSQSVETIRIENITAFVAIVNEYIDIISSSGEFTQMPWWTVWKEWLDDDLLLATDLHMVAVTVDFQTTKQEQQKI